MEASGDDNVSLRGVFRLSGRQRHRRIKMDGMAEMGGTADSAARRENRYAATAADAGAIPKS